MAQRSRVCVCELVCLCVHASVFVCVFEVHKLASSDSIVVESRSVSVWLCFFTLMRTSQSSVVSPQQRDRVRHSQQQLNSAYHSEHRVATEPTPLGSRISPAVCVCVCDTIQQYASGGADSAAIANAFRPLG